MDDRIDNYIIYSTHNTPLIGPQFAVQRLSAIGDAIRAGVRMIELDLNTIGGTLKVVRSTKSCGKWIPVTNWYSIDRVVEYISGELEQNSEVFFIYLDIKTADATPFWNVARRVFGARLFGRSNLAPYHSLGEIPRSKLRGRVVILTTSGTEHYEVFPLASSINERNGFGGIRSSGINRVYPHNAILSSNFDPRPAWKEGANCVCVNFQTRDKWWHEHRAKFINTGGLIHRNQA